MDRTPGFSMLRASTLQDTPSGSSVGRPWQAVAAVNGRSAASARCDRQRCGCYIQLLAPVPYVAESSKHRCQFLCTGEFASSVATHLMTPALFKVPSRTKDSTPCTITPDIQPILADTRN